MPAIDISQFPESARQILLAATYKAAQRFYQDPENEARFQEWLAGRRIKEGEKKK